MSEYTSPLHRCEYGPGLLVLIHMERGKIVQTDLDEVNSEGMHWQIAADQENSDLEAHVCKWLESYCLKQELKEKPPLDLEGLPPFTHQVLKELQALRFGETLSYRDLAAKAGKPQGARAVGNACGRNPLPLLIPCHRVVASNNLLGGFSLGLAIKERLLHFEGALKR